MSTIMQPPHLNPSVNVDLEHVGEGEIFNCRASKNNSKARTHQSLKCIVMEVLQSNLDFSPEVSVNELPVPPLWSQTEVNGLAGVPCVVDTSDSSCLG